MTQDVCKYLQYLTSEIGAENCDVLYQLGFFLKGALYHLVWK